MSDDNLMERRRVAVNRLYEDFLLLMEKEKNRTVLDFNTFDKVLNDAFKGLLSKHGLSYVDGGLDSSQFFIMAGWQNSSDISWVSDMVNYEGYLKEIFRQVLNQNILKIL